MHTCDIDKNDELWRFVFFCKARTTQQHKVPTMSSHTVPFVVEGLLSLKVTNKNMFESL